MGTKTPMDPKDAYKFEKICKFDDENAESEYKDLPELVPDIKQELLEVVFPQLTETVKIKVEECRLDGNTECMDNQLDALEHFKTETIKNEEPSAKWEIIEDSMDNIVLNHIEDGVNTECTDNQLVALEHINMETIKKAEWQMTEDSMDIDLSHMEDGCDGDSFLKQSIPLIDSKKPATITKNEEAWEFTEEKVCLLDPNASPCSDDESNQIPLNHRLLNNSTLNFRKLQRDAVSTQNLSIVSTAKKRRITAEVCSCSNKIAHEEPRLGQDQNADEKFKGQMPASVYNASQNKTNELRARISLLESANGNLQKKLEEKLALNRHYARVLARVFTPGQITKLKNAEKGTHIRWSSEDIASAISLFSVSPQAYRFLKRNNVPLPAVLTLRNSVLNLNLNQGILNNIITLMSKRGSDFNDMERLCVITFDEMYVSNRIDIDKKQEIVVGPHITCQVVMVRGLLSNWCQPVYYQFDEAMTKEIINKIISELFYAKFIVVAMCSGMGARNVAVWSELNVTHDGNCFFFHPCDGHLKVFVYADTTRLIKLARDNLIDNGFVADDSIVNIDVLEALVNSSTSELTLSHKLTPQHLLASESMRQLVRPAVEVFSNSVAKAIEHCGENGLMPPNSNFKKAVEIIQLFNDWFDLLNSGSKMGHLSSGQNAFGADLDHQRNQLNQMSELIMSMRVGKQHKELVTFQKGILLTNRSLVQMYDYLQEKYLVRHILTSRLNLDVLENFFAYVRGIRGANDHPCALDFKCQLRSYIVGKQPAAETNESVGNRATTEENCLTHMMLLNLCERDPKTSEELQSDEEKLIGNSFVEPRYLEEGTTSEDSIHFLKTVEFKEKLDYDSLKYMAGFVAYTFKNKYNLGSNTTKKLDPTKTPDWLQSIPSDSLLYPCYDLGEAAMIMDSEFYKMHGNFLNKEKKLFQILAQRTWSKLKNTSIPFEVILCLCRCRTYIRLRDLNRKISSENCKRKADK